MAIGSRFPSRRTQEFEAALQGWRVVMFPDFEFGVTRGESEVEAREMAADAPALILESYIEPGKLFLRRPNSRAGSTTWALQFAMVELCRQLVVSELQVGGCFSRAGGIVFADGADSRG